MIGMCVRHRKCCGTQRDSAPNIFLYPNIALQAAKARLLLVQGLRIRFVKAIQR